MPTTSPIKARYKEGVDYITTQWGTGPKAIPNYECVHCQFKHTNPDRMNEHLDLAASGGNAHVMKWPEVDDDGLVLGGKHPALSAKSTAKKTE